MASRLVVILSEAKNLSSVCVNLHKQKERFFASLRMTKEMDGKKNGIIFPHSKRKRVNNNCALFFVQAFYKTRRGFFFHVRCCARLPLQPLACQSTADAWNFGLCATKSREPRQARKGATVPGSLRVPQSTRSSSHFLETRSIVRNEQGFSVALQFSQCPLC